MNAIVNSKIKYKSVVKEMFMRTIVLLLLILNCSLLGAETLLSQNFSSSSFPTGWTMTGPSTAPWSISNTNNAGGTPYEVKFGNTPAAAGTYRFISRAFDTSKVHDMTLSFRQMLNDNSSTTTTYTIGVQISTNLVDWTNVWSLTTSSSLAATQSTASIGFELGKSSNTYIAFTFIGNNSDLVTWYIDNLELTYNDMLGIGNWPGYSSHWIEGNLIVPDGYTLQINPATSLHFSAGKSLVVDGRLLISGNANYHVLLDGGMGWNGILMNNVDANSDSTLIQFAEIKEASTNAIWVQNFDKVRISNCEFSDNSVVWGCIADYESDIIIENCKFYGNESLYPGTAIRSGQSEPLIRNNLLYNNNSPYSILSIGYCDYTQVTGNVIVNNILGPYGYAVEATGDYYHVSFDSNLIANNDGGGIYGDIESGIISINHCDIIGNSGTAIKVTGQTWVENSIIWGNTSEIIDYGFYSSYLVVGYSCIEGGEEEIISNFPFVYGNNTESNPLFVNPTTGEGSSYNALAADWHLKYNSPCIDTGDPEFPFDPDGSITDMGMYYSMFKPLITRAADVTPDQGHQLDLQWNRSDLDKVYDFNARYEIWREGSSRSDNALYVSNPLQVTEEMRSGGRDIIWRDGTRTWYYLGYVPARMQPTYGLIVPTLQDSSSTGTHAALYKASFCNSINFWDSPPISGYSVDNIPPYSPARLAITHTSGSQFNLSWQRVSEGTWQGNSYPEVNQITYKIYAGDTPDFVISPATYLLSTTNPAAVLSQQTDSMKFYKIIASDSE
jgi:hypothetical protein